MEQLQELNKEKECIMAELAECKRQRKLLNADVNNLEKETDYLISDNYKSLITETDDNKILEAEIHRWATKRALKSIRVEELKPLQDRLTMPGLSDSERTHTERAIEQINNSEYIPRKLSLLKKERDIRVLVFERDRPTPATL